MTRARRQARLAVHTAQTALASAQTIDARLRRMGAPSMVPDPENVLMVTEKIAAAQEAALAAAPAMARLGTGMMSAWMRQATLGMTLTSALLTARTPVAALSAWTSWASGSTRAMAPTAATLVEMGTKAIRPYRTRTRANARRLSAKSG